MLMKLTPVVDIINVKCTNILYKCCFGSYFLRKYVEKAAEMTFVRKIRAKNIDEIDS